MGESALSKHAVRVYTRPGDPAGLGAYAGTFVTPELSRNASAPQPLAAITLLGGDASQSPGCPMGVDRLALHVTRVEAVNTWAPGAAPPTLNLIFKRSIACDASEIQNGSLLWTPAVFGDAGGQFIAQYNNIFCEAFELWVQPDAPPMTGPIKLHCAFLIDRAGGVLSENLGPGVTVKVA